MSVNTKFNQFNQFDLKNYFVSQHGKTFTLEFVISKDIKRTVRGMINKDNEYTLCIEDLNSIFMANTKQINKWKSQHKAWIVNDKAAVEAAPEPVVENAPVEANTEAPVENVEAQAEQQPSTEAKPKKKRTTQVTHPKYMRIQDILSCYATISPNVFTSLTNMLLYSMFNPTSEEIPMNNYVSTPKTESEKISPAKVEKKLCLFLDKKFMKIQKVAEEAIKEDTMRVLSKNVSIPVSMNPDLFAVINKHLPNNGKCENRSQGKITFKDFDYAENRSAIDIDALAHDLDEWLKTIPEPEKKTKAPKKNTMTEIIEDFKAKAAEMAKEEIKEDVKADAKEEIKEEEAPAEPNVPTIAPALAPAPIVTTDEVLPVDEKIREEKMAKRTAKKSTKKATKSKTSKAKLAALKISDEEEF